MPIHHTRETRVFDKRKGAGILRRAIKGNQTFGSSPNLQVLFLILFSGSLVVTREEKSG
jgi:hypothetical protein